MRSSKSSPPAFTDQYDAMPLYGHCVFFSLEAVMNLLRNGLLMRKTGDRQGTELTE